MSRWRDDLASWPPKNPLLNAVGAERFAAHMERGEQLVLSPAEVSRFQLLMDESKNTRLRIALGLIDEMLEFLPNHLLAQEWAQAREAIGRN